MKHNILNTKKLFLMTIMMVRKPKNIFKERSRRHESKWAFCFTKHMYNTFLKSPQCHEIIRCDSKLPAHYQEDQEAQGCPLTRKNQGSMNLDRPFILQCVCMLYFLNCHDIRKPMLMTPIVLITIRKIRKLKNVL